ncbi:MAG: hypothetical protein ABSD20_14855 [Terriglobales bacterium]|jgi:hypothetical protein
MIHNVNDLLPEEKRAVEKLVGRALSGQDDISIRVLRPASQLSAERRLEILDGLKAYFAQIDSQQEAVSHEQADEVIDEALRSSRPAYRTFR